MTLDLDPGPALFEMRGRSEAALLRKPRPTENPDYIVYGRADPCDGEDVPELFVHRRVLEQLRSHALDAVPNETIGALAGRPCQDQQGTFVVVEAAIVARPGEYQGTPGSVRITAAGRATLNHRADQLHAVCQVIGWWHTHPHGAPRYSVVDLEEQATYTQAWAVGIVVAAGWYEVDRPRRDPLGVYVGPAAEQLTQVEGGVAECPGVVEPAPRALSPASRRPVPSPKTWTLPPLAPAALALTLLVAVAIALAVWVEGSDGGSDSRERPAQAYRIPTLRQCRVGEELSVPLANRPQIDGRTTVTSSAPAVSATIAADGGLLVRCAAPGAAVLTVAGPATGSLTLPVISQAPEPPPLSESAP